MARISTETRSHILFGHKLPYDPYTSRNAQEPSQPFNIIPSDFLRRAEKMRPKNPSNTVSSFSQWIYSLYAKNYGDNEDKERGKTVEQLINSIRISNQTSINNSFLKSIGSEWRLVHNGLHLEGQEHIEYFTVEDLKINNQPLRASPDLIYRHSRLNETIIVEIKNSRMNIPSNLWPNIWAQLWCYSQIEFVKNSSRTTVIGEVWGEHRIWIGRGKKREERESVYLRASERRDPRNPAFHRFFRALFDIYRGAN